MPSLSKKRKSPGDSFHVDPSCQRQRLAHVESHRDTADGIELPPVRQEPHVASPSLSKERSSHYDIGDFRNSLSKERSNHHDIGDYMDLPFSPDECIASPRILLSQLDKVDNQDISKDDRLSLTNILSKTQSRQFLIQQLLDDPVYYKEIQERLQSWQAPILSKAAYNNRPVNWSTCSTPYPINESRGSSGSSPPLIFILAGKLKIRKLRK